ncbi:MAG: hypothetical protein RIT32_961, partial [Actinomycetota bacterium]
ICVVGDPGQAIYGFAGAKSSFLVELQQRFNNATIAKLTRSYRSAPAIIHAANSFAEIPTVSQRDIAGSIEVKSLADARAEAAAVATWVSEQVSQGLALKEIAVLTRLNAQLNLIDSALTQIGLSTNLNQQRGGIDLLTIHAAKGLEWRAVAIAGVNHQLLPYEPFGLELTSDQIAEERRLFYVGLTRAADNLLLTYSRDRGPSEFLSILTADADHDLVTAASKVQQQSNAAVSHKPKVANCRFCQKGLVTPAEIAAVRCHSCAPWVASEVMDRLIQWRSEVANMQGVAPFLIFTDVALRAIAEVGDLAAAHELGIAGVTPAKVTKYQADFAELLAK